MYIHKKYICHILFMWYIDLSVSVLPEYMCVFRVCVCMCVCVYVHGCVYDFGFIHDFLLVGG